METEENSMVRVHIQQVHFGHQLQWGTLYICSLKTNLELWDFDTVHLLDQEPQTYWKQLVNTLTEMIPNTC